MLASQVGRTLIASATLLELRSAQDDVVMTIFRPLSVPGRPAPKTLPTDAGDALGPTVGDARPGPADRHVFQRLRDDRMVNLTLAYGLRATLLPTLQRAADACLELALGKEK